MRTHKTLKNRLIRKIENLSPETIKQVELLMVGYGG